MNNERNPRWKFLRFYSEPPLKSWVTVYLSGGLIVVHHTKKACKEINSMSLPAEERMSFQVRVLLVIAMPPATESCNGIMQIP